MIDFDAGPSQKRKTPPIGAMNLTLIALIMAIIGVACLIPKVYYACIIFGAIGLVLGGYCMGFIHRHATSAQTQLLVMAGASLLLSVIAFMFGFAEVTNAI